jgi:uncharacterized protein YbjT (DUF2867 family)
MSNRRIAALHISSLPLPGGYELAGPRALSYEEARDLLGLAILLRRWHRVLDACDGNREQALAVWNQLGRIAEATAGVRDRHLRLVDDDEDEEA